MSLPRRRRLHRGRDPDSLLAEHKGLPRHGLHNDPVPCFAAHAGRRAARGKHPRAGARLWIPAFCKRGDLPLWNIRCGRNGAQRHSGSLRGPGGVACHSHGALWALDWRLGLLGRCDHLSVLRHPDHHGNHPGARAVQGSWAVYCDADGSAVQHAAGRVLVSVWQHRRAVQGCDPHPAAAARAMCVSRRLWNGAGEALAKRRRRLDRGHHEPDIDLFCGRFPGSRHTNHGAHGWAHDCDALWVWIPDRGSQHQLLVQERRSQADVARNGAQLGQGHLRGANPAGRNRVGRRVFLRRRLEHQ
eukprot:comp22324_c0_seq1/m.53607 comp22324_c0_seq1/g.53607  ORF comp22324_c0_seq1/g.53607 comp22324_c0_seq1/m.53607 type:complete len:301 (-) comp22324_c0_seq1:275-1177(-)